MEYKIACSNRYDSVKLLRFCKNFMFYAFGEYAELCKKNITVVCIVLVICCSHRDFAAARTVQGAAGVD